MRKSFMKTIILLFCAIFLLNSCKPLSLDDEDGRDRDFEVDPAKGKENFSLPDLTDISAEEIVNKSMSGNCGDYRNASSFSIFGDKSPFKKAQNCLAKALDESLGPLCEDEKKAKQLLRIYEKERDEVAVQEVEEYLNDLEEIKYDTAEEIYYMADGFYEQCEEWDNEWEDEIDEAKEKDRRWYNKLLKRAGKMVVSTECQGFRRIADSRGRNPCLNIDFSRVERK